MAEAVLGVLIGKIGAALANKAQAYGVSLVLKEASALKGLFDEMHKAEGELESMKAYLHDTEKFKDTCESTGIFVKKIRHLAFRIEDVVDEFTYKLEDKHGGFVAKMKKRIKHVQIWRRLAVELRSINGELEEATKRRGRYSVPGMGYIGGTDDHVRSANQVSCIPRKEDLVGINDNANLLRQWLVDDLKEQKSKITTIWGMGGTGKTTLVDHIYKTVKKDFNTAAWVTVSKTYQIGDLLKKMARDFGIPVDASNMEMRDLVEVIRNHLEGKTYLLVLDDVWESNVWMKIMDVFPTNCMSRFVLTSRNYEVASLATGNCAIYLDPLKQDQSWELFCNIAFRNSDDKQCPSELQYWARKFLQKCDGLPLAITCIGRLLSCKPPTFPAWRNVYEELELQSSKDVIPGVDGIIKLSLEDLSYELKNCFLHCAMFPEDYDIRRKRLIRHWITAGFIKEQQMKTSEEVAEDFLNELVKRSLLQVIVRNEYGRVKFCKMHDIIRHIALDKAKEECFGVVYEGSSTFSTDGIRRLSIQSANISPLSQSGATNLRAIYAFTSDVDVDLLRPILASSRMLSMLDLQGTQIKMLPDEVFSLFNLRFLGIRMTKIDTLSEAIGRLRNLEVLDALGTSLTSLPKSVAKLKKLRFLYACTMVSDGSINDYGGVKVPRGIGNLTGLHALQNVEASLETLCDVAALTELRTFAVNNVTSEHSSNLSSAIMNMSHLVHLQIYASNENVVLPLDALRLPETLSMLELIGQLDRKQMPRILLSWSHVSNLSKLFLKFSNIDQETFSRFIVLRGLRVLSLIKAYVGKKLLFSSSSFPKLQRLLVVDAPELNRVEIEEGALESLIDLEFLRCPELRGLPHGIQYLINIDELRCEGQILKNTDIRQLGNKAEQMNAMKNI